jgi:glycosyltransferase involved in cell wall biosynthesis
MTEILFIHNGIPRKDDSSMRSERALRWLADRHQVTLISVRPGDEPSRPSEQGLPEGVICQTHPIPMRRGLGSLAPLTRVDASELDSWLGSLEADWIWLGWWGLGVARRAIQRLRSRGVLVTLDWDAMSLWHLTAARALVRDAPLYSVGRTRSFVEAAVYERYWLRHLDALSVPARIELAWLERTAKKAVLRIRNAIDVGSYEMVRETRPSECDPVVIFVGTLDYQPNVDALRWFIKHVWPRVRGRTPAARFRIVGRGNPAPIGSLPERSGVELVGGVDDVRSEYRVARVAVVPVRFGGGVPTKVLEAAAGGRPQVATPFVAQRLDGLLGVLSARDADRFASAVSQLLGDSRSADRLGAQAARTVSETHGLESWMGDMSRFESSVLRL